MTGTWDFPYDIDQTGRTATTDGDGHVRDLIEQVLLTSPGERVMRPDFGSGLLSLVFERGGDQAAATAQFLVQGALEHWLSDVLTVEAVLVEADEATLIVTVRYVVLGSPTTDVARFSTAGAGA